MNLKTFYNSVKNAVARDADLASWAQAIFGRPLNVWADLPSDDFPNVESDYPFVVLTTPEKSSDQDRRQIEYDLEAWLAFSKADYKDDGDLRVTEASGIELMCDMLEYVKAAIVAARPADSTVAFSELVDALGRPPEVNGYLAMRFRHRPSIGYGDPTIT